MLGELKKNKKRRGNHPHKVIFILLNPSDLKVILPYAIVVRIYAG